ncbi:ATP-binding cassette sub-family G member 4 [Hydra vulgaris]|uniref:ATP-binding cassette sub-family G member 4 n=1 Tax=Hydra vulgaris TaxID=6087 RepID=A0ABM4B6Y2_HYDVU
MKEQKESISLTNCCLKSDKPETISITTDYKDAYVVEETSLIINGASIFQGPTVNIDIEFQDLTYEVKIKKHEKKTILKNLNGAFKSGELVAVLGPSGAGKSSLLNILAGYSSNDGGVIGGKILVNGIERNLRRFRKLSCYIMQDDVLMPNLTVIESMMVSANLHLKSILGYKEKRRVVEDILSIFGLSHICNTYMSEISGGQRKRLAIALELVNNPPVIFLDEPTSGLDSSSAFQCISLLKSLAQGGRTVICTIHQPSAKLFEMFDKIYLLTAGHCIYNGSILNLLPYMETQNLICPKYHNPADFIIEVASGEYGDILPQLVKGWKIQEKREELKRMESEDFGLNDNVDALLAQQTMMSMLPSCGFRSSTDSLSSTTSQTTQFTVLSKRAMISIVRDKMFTHLRLVSVLVVAVIIGLLYLDIGDDGNKVQNNTGCLFFSMLFLLFIALMPTVLTFPLEKTVFIREHLNNWYSLKSYYLAKTMSDLPFQVFLPLIYCSIVYFMTGQPKDATRYIQYVSVTILTCLVAQSIGLLLGAVAPNVPTAVFVAPVTGIPVLLFSGFFVSFDTIPKYMQWLTYISFARYSWEGMMVAIYGNKRGNLTCNDDLKCLFRQSNDVLDSLDINESALNIKQGKFYFDCVVLSMFFVTLRLVTYMVLRYKVKSTAR